MRYDLIEQLQVYQSSTPFGMLSYNGTQLCIIIISIITFLPLYCAIITIIILNHNQVNVCVLLTVVDVSCFYVCVGRFTCH